MRNKLLTPSFVRFLIIGASAFLLHWLCVIFVVNTLEITPLLANIIGFLCAFSISYLGHKNWTFNANKQSHSTALSRFMQVAFIGFLINESSYAILLSLTTLDYRLGLIIALLLASLSTYLLSKNWAFNENK
jgi:putative flippase GtrA